MDQEKPIIDMKKEMRRRRLSERTVESYCFCVKKFLNNVKKDPKYISKKDVINYLDDLAETNKAGSTLNIYLCAIRFLMEDTLRKDMHLNIRYSRRPKSLPTVLTKEETKKLFSAIENPKHKLMIQLMYSGGLRVSELLNLKAKDFEFNRNYGWVRKGKGSKDRVFIIADRLKRDIVHYISRNRLSSGDLLFKGWKNTKMHPSTIREIIKKATKKSKIEKHIHPHTLRHSFATHLVEDNNDLIDVQKLLGHNSIQTTMIYVHMADPNFFQ